jgi:hypothetical protein
VRSASWWIEWPTGPIRIGVLFLVAAAAIAVLVTYPGLVREAGDEAGTNSAQSYTDREIAGGNGLVVDQEAVYAARALIPSDATYHVAVAPDYVGESELTQGHVASYFRYFLMPRRPAESAPWVVCYGCDLAEYGPDAEVLWRGTEEDVSIVRVPS